MGWASGADVMSGVIGAVQKEVKDKKSRKRIYKEIIEVLENSDWDTQDECRGEDSAYDEVLDELYPE